MESLTRQTEARYNLPHGTCRAFALQESHYDSSATREEGTYFNQGSRYARQITKDAAAFLVEHPGLPLSIERGQRSVSYGMFQIMGNNYRLLGDTDIYIVPTLEEQFDYFGKFVSPLFAKYRSLARVASAYNTGSPDKTGISYVSHVLSYQHKFTY